MNDLVITDSIHLLASTIKQTRNESARNYTRTFINYVGIQMQGGKLFKSRPLKVEKTPPKSYVYVLKMDFPDMPPKRIPLPKSMKSLLEEATKALGMNRAAQTIYDEAGYLLDDIDVIPVNATLYISANPAEREKHDEIFGNRKPTTSEDRSWAKLNLPLMKPPKEFGLPENRDLHFAIASRKETVKENIRNSLLSLYSTLSREHKDQLQCSCDLQKMLNETQIHLLQDSLLKQFIGPTSSLDGFTQIREEILEGSEKVPKRVLRSSIAEETKEWMMQNLEGVEIKNCRFVFGGPEKSGKSTLLYIAVILFLQRLQLSNEASEYIIVPFNWQKIQLIMHNVGKVYDAFVDAVVDAVQAANMKFMPIIEDLRQWLHSLIVLKGFPKVPERMTDFTEVSADSLSSYGQQVHKAWSSENGISEFVTRMVQMPALIAEMFGFENAVCVYDHFDGCDYILEDPSRFGKSEAFLPDILCTTLQNCPFFIATSCDDVFSKIFAVQRYTHLTTKRIITQTIENDIVSACPSVAIKMDMCGGYPGYCALYNKIYSMADKARENVAIKLNLPSKFRSTADHVRRKIISDEFMRLCLLIAKTTELIDEDTMNELTSQDEFDVYVR